MENIKKYKKKSTYFNSLNSGVENKFYMRFILRYATNLYISFNGTMFVNGIKYIFLILLVISRVILKKCFSET